VFKKPFAQLAARTRVPNFKKEMSLRPVTTKQRAEGTQYIRQLAHVTTGSLFTFYAA